MSIFLQLSSSDLSQETWRQHADLPPPWESTVKATNTHTIWSTITVPETRECLLMVLLVPLICQDCGRGRQMPSYHDSPTPTLQVHLGKSSGRHSTQLIIQLQIHQTKYNHGILFAWHSPESRACLFYKQEIQRNSYNCFLYNMASRLSHICLDRFCFATSCSKKNKNVSIQFVSPLLEGRIRRAFSF